MTTLVMEGVEREKERAHAVCRLQVTKPYHTLLCHKYGIHVGILRNYPPSQLPRLFHHWSQLFSQFQACHFHPLALTGNLCAFVIFSFLQKVGNAPHYLCMLSLKQYTQWLVQMGSKGLRSTYRWLLYLSRGSISLVIFPFSQYSHHDRLVQQVAFHCMNNKFKFYFVAIRALRDKQVFWIIQSHNFGCLCLAFDAHQSWTAFLPELKSSMPFQSLLKP